MEEDEGGSMMMEEDKREAVLIKPGVQDEDAAELNLGEEFQPGKAQPLFLSEAGHLLGVKLQKQQAGAYAPEINPVLKKSVEYAQRFDSIMGTEQAVDVRAQLEQVKPELHPFEIAQLASLVPQDAEEAKAIIPSLSKHFENDVLNDVLKNMNTFVK